jgi:hypothetical protein
MPIENTLSIREQATSTLEQGCSLLCDANEPETGWAIRGFIDALAGEPDPENSDLPMGDQYRYAYHLGFNAGVSVLNA